MQINNKYYHLPYIMESVMAAHTVDNRYPDTCWCLTEVEAHKRPRSTLKCKSTKEGDVVVLNY